MERLSVPLQFSLVDELIREHRPPGSSQVVVGVQHMRRSVESVELWNLKIKKDTFSDEINDKLPSSKLQTIPNHFLKRDIG